mgnify:CR=1 FL=1
MPSFSTTLEQAIHAALSLANQHRHELATLEHLLLALTETGELALVAATVVAAVTALFTFCHAAFLFIRRVSAPVGSDPGGPPAQGQPPDHRGGREPAARIIRTSARLRAPRRPEP